MKVSYKIGDFVYAKDAVGNMVKCEVVGKKYREAERQTAYRVRLLASTRYIWIWENMVIDKMKEG